MKRKPLPKPRSLAARALESPLFRMQKVKTLKGKGSYKRRPKHRGGVSVFGVTIFQVFQTPASSLLRNRSLGH